MLEVFHLYNDLQKEIDILENQIELSINERKQWHPWGRVGSRVPLQIAAENIDKLSEKIEWMDEVLQLKKKAKVTFEKNLSEISQLEYKVAYMRYVEKKTLEQIAEELNYSIDWIKRISSRVSVHFTTLTS